MQTMPPISVPFRAGRTTLARFSAEGKAPSIVGRTVHDQSLMTSLGPCAQERQRIQKRCVSAGMRRDCVCTPLDVCAPPPYRAGSLWGRPANTNCSYAWRGRQARRGCGGHQTLLGLGGRPPPQRPLRSSPHPPHLAAHRRLQAPTHLPLPHAAVITDCQRVCSPGEDVIAQGAPTPGPDPKTRACQEGAEGKPAHKERYASRTPPRPHPCRPPSDDFDDVLPLTNRAAV